MHQKPRTKPGLIRTLALEQGGRQPTLVHRDQISHGDQLVPRPPAWPVSFRPARAGPGLPFLEEHTSRKLEGVDACALSRHSVRAWPTGLPIKPVKRGMRNPCLFPLHPETRRRWEKKNKENRKGDVNKILGTDSEKWRKPNISPQPAEHTHLCRAGSIRNRTQASLRKGTGVQRKREDLPRGATKSTRSPRPPPCLRQTCPQG